MTNKVMVSKKQYGINTETMALLPFYDEYGKVHTKVLERDRTLCVCGKPKAVVTFSCGYYGSSYKGRKDGASLIMGIRSRAPIVISEQLGIFFYTS
ncbi:competence protein ComK [Fictibacillus terranigra]|uniref:Competence protein ComK n=1 Tax=Fictibacillus terranigra TaxID=3058424 RepID=A0ABT8E811_9BACL|nr:competence protein ComK [Fictibacillus sp. CENA-BCM004]MDN4074041.1 competence protein ComK [Fictibacillus sp. CENA-BCM004]